MSYYNPITPPLILFGQISGITQKDLYEISDDTGLLGKPTTYTITVNNIRTQLLGDESLRNGEEAFYNGFDIKVGDFVAQVSGAGTGRKIYRIKSITSKLSTSIVCVIEDVDMIVARTIVSKDNLPDNGQDVLIFEVNGQNQPILYGARVENSDSEIPAGVYSSIITYFNTYNPLFNRRFFQDPAPNITLSDNVTINSSGQWTRATSGDTILGQVSSISSDPRTFYVRPNTKIIDNFEYPQGLTGGSVGDIWYSDPDVNGGYTTTNKNGSKELYFQISNAVPTTVIGTSEFTLLSGQELIINRITGATGPATQSQVISQINSKTTEHYVFADEYSSIAIAEPNTDNLHLNGGPVVVGQSLNGDNPIDITVSDGTNSVNIVFSGTPNINYSTGTGTSPNVFSMQDTPDGDGVVTIMNSVLSASSVNVIAEVVDEQIGTFSHLKSIRIKSTVPGETITITTNTQWNGKDFAASGVTTSMVGITNLIESEINGVLRLTRSDGGDIMITGSDSVINRNGYYSSSNGNPPLLQILTSGGSGESGSSGSSGTSGTSGSSGTDGSSGSSGTSGTSGSSGTDGSSGSSGTSGTSGSSGTSGTSGVDGIGLRGDDGSSGSSGTSGTSGSSGTDGSSGSSGTSGTSGSSGTDGSSGSSGTSGTSGSSGTDGSSGSSGTSGTSGSSGTSGTSGKDGSGSGRVYYFNESITEVAGIKELGSEPTTSSENNVSITAIQNTDTKITQYISDPFDFTIIPGGVQRFFLWLTKENLNDHIEVYVKLSVTDNSGNILVTAGTSAAVDIGFNNNNTTPVITEVDITFPSTTVQVGQRMLVEIWARNNVNQNRNVTLYTEGSSHYSYVVTTVSLSSGTSGTSGSSGTDGSSGSSGTSGTSGSSGTDGSSGSSGTSGTSGSSGTDGSSGSSGTSGTSGSSGTDGSSGSSGTSGTSGSSGVSVDVYDDTTLISSGVSEITFSGESVSVVTGSTEDSVIVTITGGTSLTVSANTGVELTETDVLYTIYNTNLSPTLEMDTNVGGIDSGTLVSDLTGKTFVELFNDLLFPTVQPTYTPSSLTFVGSPSTSTVEVGSSVNVDFYGKGIKNDAGDFTTIRLLKNGIVQYTDSVLTISSESPIANQFGYLNPNTPNSGFTSDSWSETLTVPSPSAGNTQTTTTYTVNGDYNAGLPKKDNKGDDDVRTALTRNSNRPQAAQNNYSPGNKTVTGIYPYFWGKASTNKPTVSDIQNAISGGTANKVLAKASNDITITYNAVDEFLWFAHFSEYNNKTNWVITPNTNEGTIGEQLIDSPIENQVIDGPDGYWSGINFNIYISSYATTTVSPITFE